MGGELFQHALVDFDSCHFFHSFTSPYSTYRSTLPPLRLTSFFWFWNVLWFGTTANKDEGVVADAYYHFLPLLSTFLSLFALAWRFSFRTIEAYIYFLPLLLFCYNLACGVLLDVYLGGFYLYIHL